METELKRCPFCGAKARWNEHRVGWSLSEFDVGCVRCHVTTRSSAKKSRVIAKWNRRDPAIVATKQEV